MGERMVIAPAWRDALAAENLDHFQAIARLDRGDLVKDRRSIQVRRLTLGSGQVLFIKQYWANNFQDIWGGIFRGSVFGKSKVQREYDNLAQLRTWNIAAAEPVAYGEQRSSGCLVKSFLITKGIPSPLPLDQYILNQLEPNKRADLLSTLADAVRALHGHQFIHHDLYWRNIILSGTSLEHYYLIDCHKGAQWSNADAIEPRAQDLAGLDAPAPAYFRRSERLRFFLRYRQHQRLSDGDKSMIRRIMQIAEPLRDRQLKRVRETRG